MGWLTAAWLSYIVSEADHRLSEVEPWAATRLTPLAGVIPEPVGQKDFTDDRLADLLRWLSDDEVWVTVERELGARLVCTCWTGSWCAWTAECVGPPRRRGRHAVRLREQGPSARPGAVQADVGRPGSAVLPLSGEVPALLSHLVATADQQVLTRIERRPEPADEEPELLARQLTGWHIVLVADRASPHRAKASRRLPKELGIEMRWLVTACPELNPIEGLWRGGKAAVVANEPTPDVATSTLRLCAYLLGMSPTNRLKLAGVLSDDFWVPT